MRSQGDTNLLPSGRGNGVSAATVVGLAAIQVELEALIVEGQAIAAAAMGLTESESLYNHEQFIT